MDILLILLSGFLILLGILGSFLPIIPGPLTSWLGILILSFSEFVIIDKVSLVVSFIIALGIFVMDYFVPVLGAKKFGGGRGSIIGSSVGLICGILFQEFLNWLRAVLFLPEGTCFGNAVDFLRICSQGKKFSFPGRSKGFVARRG